MQQPCSDRWMKIVLRLAAVHCVVWGGIVIVQPSPMATLYGLTSPPTDIWLWKGTGLVILLLGLGYGIASTDPRRHYAVVLIGLLAKVLGPVGLCWSVYWGEIPVSTLYLLPINDVIWWIPFGWIVWKGVLHGGKETCGDV